jgi:hypothetical protein
MFSSDRSKSKSESFSTILYFASTAPTAAKAQQLPQDPWFFTGVVQSPPPTVLQSKAAGGSPKGPLGSDTGPASPGESTVSPTGVVTVAFFARSIISVTGFLKSAADVILPHVFLVTQTAYSEEREFFPSLTVSVSYPCLAQYEYCAPTLPPKKSHSS